MGGLEKLPRPPYLVTDSELSRVVLNTGTAVREPQLIERCERGFSSSSSGRRDFNDARYANVVVLVAGRIIDHAVGINRD